MRQQSKYICVPVMQRDGLFGCWVFQPNKWRVGLPPRRAGVFVVFMGPGEITYCDWVETIFPGFRTPAHCLRDLHTEFGNYLRLTDVRAWRPA